MNATDCSNYLLLTEDQLSTCLDIRNSELQFSIDTIWVLVTSMGILSLQTGFAMLEAGTVDAKNVKSVLMKNATDMIFGTIFWWGIGFGLFTGDGQWAAGFPNLFFITEAQSDSFPFLVQQYGFAITSTTIVSGSVLSRMKFEVYLAFSVIFVSVVYGVIAHVAWATNGWLYTLGYLDFAGSGVVHLLGGVAGLIGAYLVGPREGRFYAIDEEVPGAVRPLVPHSMALVALGAFMLYIGWFSFNAGSSGGMGPGQIDRANRAMINTLLGSAAGGMATACYSIYLKRQHDVALVLNGMLTGLVAITGPSGYVDTWAAVVIGTSAGLVYIPSAYYLLHGLKIDDPVNAFPIHGVGGAWGVILTGFFALPEFGGLVYTGNSSLLVAQLVGAGLITAWSAVCSLTIFLILKCLFGLKIGYDEQLMGLDVSYHSGAAYPEFDHITVREYEATRRRLSVNPGRDASIHRRSAQIGPNIPRKLGTEASSMSRVHML